MFIITMTSSFHQVASALVHDHYATNVLQPHMLSVLQVHVHLMGISSPHSFAHSLHTPALRSTSGGMNPVEYNILIFI